MDRTLELLAAWMPQQRWYASKGRAPVLRHVASWDHPTSDVDVSARTLLVADDAAAVLYQVPVVTRPAGSAAGEVIGEIVTGVVLVDGVRDAAYTSALLDLAARGGTLGGDAAGASGHPAAAATEAPIGAPADVLRGEQSNTSIIYRPEAGTPVIVKVFRQVHPGLNPDIELQSALADDGSPFVPRAVGSVEGRWPGAGGEVRTGSLAFAQEFLPGVEDAWRVALRAAANGEDFTAQARALGAATAEVHVALARLFPVTVDVDHAAVVGGWHRRLTTAVVEAPAVGEARAAIDALYDGATLPAWPPLQRVHGDYHLGQVILVPGRGWVLLDFEGEPLRPMPERTANDLALRDVAGMLRSFDYVAGSIALDGPASAADTVDGWAADARAAFLDGYEQASGAPLAPVQALVDALEADKAVYEAVYEARNRPTWLGIPLRAIGRLTA